MQPIAALFILALGAWTVEFNEDAQTFKMTHEAAQVVVEGSVAFESKEPGWRIATPRDAVPGRLALLDPAGNAQGYLVFNAQGDRLEALVYHRTRQFYQGTIRFAGVATAPNDAFACSTREKTGSKTISFASGNATSAKFDSVFAPKTDLALKFDAASLVVRPDESGEPGKFRIEASGRIDRASEAVFAVEADQNYFQKRWVPYYAPIDRARCPKAPTGWMSWNVYFDKATAEDNLAEARIGKKYLQPFGLEFWSIESWQGNSDKLPVSKFYNLNLERNEKQFPLGMKRLADDIRALGFRPGLWTAPFGTGSTEFYEAHKDWFLHNPDGSPMSTWNGKYTIDPSNDEVIDHLRKIHEIASKEWGYEFFKIDGMSGSGPGYCAHFFERTEVRAAFKNPDVVAPFERCVRAFREGIGDDRVFLACQGHFTGPEAKYADAARTGADIVHPNEPVKWANVLNQAGRTLNQVFVNNILFYSDPDTLLVRDLPLEEARVTATVVALPGQQTFFGDFLADLPQERMKILQQTLPVCESKPCELFPTFEQLPIWDLKVARDFAEWDVVALFNWNDEPQRNEATLDDLGLPQGEYVAYEFWTNASPTIFDSKLVVDAQPARSVRLFAVHKRQDVPQFLSSDRHLTQGAVDLEDLAWDAETNALKCALRLVGGFPTTARFLAPQGYKYEGVYAEGALCKAESETTAAGEVVAVTLTSKESGVVRFELKFEKN